MCQANLRLLSTKLGFDTACTSEQQWQTLEWNQWWRIVCVSHVHCSRKVQKTAREAVIYWSSLRNNCRVPNYPLQGRDAARSGYRATANCILKGTQCSKPTCPLRLGPATSGRRATANVYKTDRLAWFQGWNLPPPPERGGKWLKSRHRKVDNRGWKLWVCEVNSRTCVEYSTGIFGNSLQ